MDLEKHQEIRAAIQAVERAASRALESFDRMISDGNMSNALEAGDDMSRIIIQCNHLQRIVQSQAEAVLARLIQELGIDSQLETDGNVITFPNRPN